MYVGKYVFFWWSFYTELWIDVQVIFVYSSGAMNHLDMWTWLLWWEACIHVFPATPVAYIVSTHVLPHTWPVFTAPKGGTAAYASCITTTRQPELPFWFWDFNLQTCWGRDASLDPCWDRPTNVGLLHPDSSGWPSAICQFHIPNPRFARPQLAHITERSPGCDDMEVAVWFFPMVAISIGYPRLSSLHAHVQKNPGPVGIEPWPPGREP